jgi:glycosyltransferase involved in cell wall biosynthesis
MEENAHAAFSWKIDMSDSHPLPSGQIRFSIVVVTWNNGSDIAQALQSCVFPSFSHYEVIVIYNKSDDHTLAEVNSICSQHGSLFRVICNDENVGLGEARNQGMRLAKGDYIAFLDGDDWFRPNALSALDAHVAAHSPDVLYYNFARSYPDGRVVPNSRHKLLAEGWRPTGRDRASLLRNFGVAWNRLYRRSFLENHKLTFPRGLYEDICWNTKVLALAELIYVIPDILTMYRQREGSILGSRGNQHFDTLGANRRVIEFLRARPDLIEDFGLAAYRYTQRQLIVTFRKRIPKQSRANYIMELDAIISDYEKLLGVKRRSVDATLILLPLSTQVVYWALSTRQFFVRLCRHCKVFWKSKVRRLPSK